MIRYASHEEMEMVVEERFEEEISELNSKIEELEETIRGLEQDNDRLDTQLQSCDEDINNLEADKVNLIERETDLEKQRDELQDTLYDTRKFIEWVIGAYPHIEVEYHAIMQIKGEGYGIPKHSSI